MAVPPTDSGAEEVGEDVPSRGPSLFEKAGLSPGGQVYTNTELGQLFYGG